LLLSGTVGVIVTRQGDAEAVITRTDLINYWVAREKDA
jgi:hypothetical protein